MSSTAGEVGSSHAIHLCRDGDTPSPPLSHCLGSIGRSCCYWGKPAPPNPVSAVGEQQIGDIYVPGIMWQSLGQDTQVGLRVLPSEVFCKAGPVWVPVLCRWQLLTPARKEPSWGLLLPAMGLVTSSKDKTLICDLILSDSGLQAHFSW